MGKGDIDESLLERCPDYCCQCEHFRLPSFTRDLILLEFISPRCVVYRTICERLEATAYILDATECFQEMMGELGEEVYTCEPMTEWFYGEFIFYPFSVGIQPFLPDFIQRCLSTPNRNPTSLLREWAKARLTNGTWKDALDLAVSVGISLRYRTLRKIDALFCLQFTPPKVAIYQAIVECLVASDRIADAVECFHQMTSELGEKIDLEWVLGKWSCTSSAALLV